MPKIVSRKNSLEQINILEERVVDITSKVNIPWFQ